MQADQTQYVIGVDVGGTNTDAALLKLPEKQIVSGVKASTTKDIQSGIKNAIQQLISKNEGISKDQIRSVMLGTTAFVNAVLQSSDELKKISIVRLCGPATHALPPFIGWPEKLRSKIENKIFMAQGGYEYNTQELSALDPAELNRFAQEMIEDQKAGTVEYINLVISGVFSPIKTDQEDQAAKIFEEAFTQAGVKFTITVSHELS